MLSGANPGAKKGCRISLTGKCKTCPHYRTMPFDVTDPTTGEVLRAGRIADCSFAWAMMGSWDAGRQTEFLHAGVNQAQNEATARQEQLLGFVAGRMLQNFPVENIEVIENAEGPDKRNR